MSILNPVNRQIHRALLQTKNTEYRNKLEHTDLGGMGIYEHGRLHTRPKTWQVVVVVVVDGDGDDDYDYDDDDDDDYNLGNFAYLILPIIG